MACGNGHITRQMLGRLAITGSFQGLFESSPATPIELTGWSVAPPRGIEPTYINYARPNSPDTVVRVDGTGMDKYVDDRGNPRRANQYPHIHHGPDRASPDYFVQNSRAPKGVYRSHPADERITFSGHAVPDDALIDMAVDLLGAMLRGEPLE
jgi:hypothetical protein